MAKEQQAMAKEQEMMAKEQTQRAKEQKQMMDAIKLEMIKDGLIKKDGNYELMINNRKMLINGKLMDESTHTKYIKLINSKRNKAFGEKEEWRVNESKQ